MVSDGEFYFEIMIVFAGGTSAIRFLLFRKSLGEMLLQQTYDLCMIKYTQYRFIIMT